MTFYLDSPAPINLVYYYKVVFFGDLKLPVIVSNVELLFAANCLKKFLVFEERFCDFKIISY
jgi:hypothetical protein